MGEPAQHAPARRIVAAFSRYAAALQWARDEAVAAWGPIALASDEFRFQETDYYQATMGADLLKVFWVFERPMDPAELVADKLTSGTFEAAYAKLQRHPEPRPLNLDPGYLTSAKLVLASTKDHAHRIYLSRGIYAEVTLHYQQRSWRHHEWTFPDYRRADYQEFFTHARDQLRRQERQERPK